MPLAAPGTAAVEALRPFVRRCDAVLIAGNGALAWGPTLETAWLRLELVEHLCRIAHHAAQDRDLFVRVPVILGPAKGRVGIEARPPLAEEHEFGIALVEQYIGVGCAHRLERPEVRVEGETTRVGGVGVVLAPVVAGKVRERASDVPRGTAGVDGGRAGHERVVAAGGVDVHALRAGRRLGSRGDDVYAGRGGWW